MTAQATHVYIANALAGAQSGQRNKTAKQLSAELGVSVQTIYTWGKHGGFTSGRSKRSDAGAVKIDVTQEQLAAVAKIIHASHSEKGRIPLTAHEAVRLAEINNIIPVGLVSPDYLNTWMRKRKISKRDALARTPHIRLMSKYPNHTHMIDASQCAQWYIADDGLVRHQRRGMDVYSNKEGHDGKVTRTILMDHYSGSFFVWYHKSETALDWIEMLYYAWAPKDFLRDQLASHCSDIDLNQAFPFHGLPEFVYADNGSPITAYATENVLRNLGIDFGTHLPYRPRGKGANETLQRHWESWFESRLHLEKATSLEQLNALAFMQCAQINAHHQHSRHGMRRFEIWQRDIEKLRLLPDYDIYKTFAQSRPVLRKVNHDGTLSFTPKKEKKRLYWVPNSSLYGKKVEVSFCLYDFPKVRVVSPVHGLLYECEPLEQNAAGFYPQISATLNENYKRNHDTDVQKAFKEHGFAESKKSGLWEATEPVKLPVVHETEIDVQDSEPLNIQPIPFTEPEQEFVVMHDRIKAKLELLRRLGASGLDDIHPLQREIIEELPYRDISQAELDAAFTELTQVDPAIIISLNEGAAQA